jgi:glycine/D-amino acid oxidase-like deaminating enzyme
MGIPAETDILVIGGGPAGTCAATELAGRGYGVVLVDKARHPRDVVGESILPHAWRYFDRLGATKLVEPRRLREEGRRRSRLGGSGHRDFIPRFRLRPTWPACRTRRARSPIAEQCARRRRPGLRRRDGGEFRRGSRARRAEAADAARSRERYFLDACMSTPHLGALLEGAQLSEGGVRLMRDFSYSSSKIAGPGYFVIGDAAGFVDPIFSIGVVVALYAGELAAWAIDPRCAGLRTRRPIEPCSRRNWPGAFSFTAPWSCPAGTIRRRPRTPPRSTSISSRRRSNS